MPVPKAKSRTVQSHRLSGPDGVKDVKIGRASVDHRLRGNAHVTGKGAERDDSDFDDVKARNERFGPFSF